MLYIKEQFDLRRFRRDYVSSDYRKKYEKVQENLLHSNMNKNTSGETFDLDEDSFDTQREVNDNEIDSDLDLSTNMMSDNDDEIEADNFLTSEEKQASYYEQEYYKRGKPKSLDVSELHKTFNAILSNYDTCTEQMKLVVNSIALSVNEITQTDGQNCGIFRHVDRTEINKKYANEKNC